MVKNVNNNKDKEEYKQLFFTNTGYETLEYYLKNLILEYVSLERTYPSQLSAVLGVPLFKYAMNIKSEDELLGRIKILGQILGIDSIEFDTEEYKVKFNMDGKYEFTTKSN